MHLCAYGKTLYFVVDIRIRSLVREGDGGKSGLQKIVTSKKTEFTLLGGGVGVSGNFCEWWDVRGLVNGVT